MVAFWFIRSKGSWVPYITQLGGIRSWLKATQEGDGGGASIESAESDLYINGCICSKWIGTE